MLGLPSEMVRGLARAWVEECESLSRAAAGVLTGALSATPLLTARPTLHWERTGSGPPVLLIMGLGLSGGAWWRTVRVLAGRLEVLTFDNRGVGHSRAMFHAYSTATMADDAVSVLDAAGVERAHVYGISLGGMVAQHVALRHPERVRSLVLGATYAGGRHARRPDPDVLAFLRRRLWMRHEEAARSSVQFNYSERCRAENPERIDEDLALRLAHPFSAQAYRAQMWAATTHDTYRQLGRIAAPTLVVHGTEDLMIPIDNGRMIAERIPGARLIELARTGHLYPTEAPAVDEEISAFMRSHS
jgi:pimeloyl-ACP methyl ester carboxylesterase